MSKYNQIIRKLTLKEKVSLLSGEDFFRTRQIKHMNIPQMELADGPHGLRKQASKGDHLGLVKGMDATCFPTAATIANSWDLDLCHEVGQALGGEAVYNDVNIVLGPGLNIKRNPLCGRNFEYFSEDPYLSGKMAAAYTKGIQEKGIGACLKHFVANNQEYLRMTNDSIVDDRTLHEIYLTGFEIAVKEGKPKAVMASYNKINGFYANENKYLLSDVLVEQWGFDGIVVSDWGGSNDAVKGVSAGTHLEMPSTGNDSINQLIQAVSEGQIEENLIDQRVEEYLNVLYDTQIREKEMVDYEKNHKIAQKAAENSIVLLKNDNVLPLVEKSKVAIIGDFARNPRYQGAGSSMVSPYKLESTLELIGETDLELIGYAQGYNRIGKLDDSMISEAVALAKRADIAILYIGLNEINEVEGHDRQDLQIADNQTNLIKAISKVAKKTIAVISGGSIIEVPWEGYCDAIVHGYLSGQGGAGAILNILTGKVNPSGKLSETYPINYEDCPSVRYYPGKEKTSEYREGLYIGYRYYDKASIEVRYPFGYGLSYTTFDYSNLVIQENGVKCKIKNSGDIAGSEIIQLYVSINQGKIHRPEKELKGFTKVFLQPQETAEVIIPFDEYTFRCYDTSINNYVIVKGKYNILIGSSSQDIRLKGHLEMDGVDLSTDDRINHQKYFYGNVTDVTLEEFEQLYGKTVPESRWDRTKELTMNDSLSQMMYARSRLARLVLKIVIRLRNKSLKKGKPDLNLFFLSNMPFRAIAKMSDGKFSIDMTKSLVKIVNGHFFKGLNSLRKSFFDYKSRG